MQKNPNKLKRDLTKYKFTFNQMVPNGKRCFIPIIPLPQNYTQYFGSLQLRRWQGQSLTSRHGIS